MSSSPLRYSTVPVAKRERRPVPRVSGQHVDDDRVGSVGGDDPDVSEPQFEPDRYRLGRWPGTGSGGCLIDVTDALAWGVPLSLVRLLDAGCRGEEPTGRPQR